MSAAARQSSPAAPIFYPETDDQPMAENDLQYAWIVLIKENISWLFPEVCVKADMFWYPVEGRPDIVTAPDIFVALGRDASIRGSYRQWEEGGVAPQVVFEIWSPSNDFPHQLQKHRFYERHGVEEFYGYCPQTLRFHAFHRGPGGLEAVDASLGLTSPRLGIRFAQGPEGLEICDPQGQPFVSPAELRRRQEQATAEAAQLRAAAQMAQEQAQMAQEQAQLERGRAERLAARLRELGLDPDQA
jgi:Uma2 family endonuclease